MNQKIEVDTQGAAETEDDTVAIHKICEWQPFLPYDSNLYPTQYGDE